MCGAPVGMGTSEWLMPQAVRFWAWLGTTGGSTNRPMARGASGGPKPILVRASGPARPLHQVLMEPPGSHQNQPQGAP